MNITDNAHHEKLIDKFDRHINYVRISVTDRCDFRCIYCMSENMQFVPRAQLLTLEEISFIAKAFSQLGVEKIRITGGEPLIRKDIIQLFENIGKVPKIKELTTTTNGSQLEWLKFTAHWDVLQKLVAKKWRIFVTSIPRVLPTK